MRRYAATLGCFAKPASVRSSWLWSGPSYCMAQPALCVIGSTPSTFGYWLRRPLWRIFSAMYLLVLAEQLTVLMMAR